MRGVRRTDLNVSKICALYVTDLWSLAEIARHFATGPTLIGNMLRKAGVERRKCNVHGERVREKIRSARAKNPSIGEKNPMFGKAHRYGSRKRISQRRIESGIARGEKNPNFKHGAYCEGGERKVRRIEMQSFLYREWRAAVFTRDNYTCAECFARGGTLHAHHIRPWRYYPDDRYAVSNGITLCKNCHQKGMKDVFTHRRADEPR